MHNAIAAVPPSSARVAREHNPYARIRATSLRIRWAIDRDVIRGRRLDSADKFLPDGLSLVDRVPFLRPDERRLMSQVQGRSYANIFGLVERFISAKALELGSHHALGDQDVYEALVGFSEEELKHQELFRRIEKLAADALPAGYRFTADPNQVARAVLSSSTWAVLALTCHIELFTLAHYKESIDGDPQLSELYKDVFRYHFMEESQHAELDELEWRREDRKLTPQQRSAAVADLIGLVVAVDGIITAQATTDATYFLSALGRALHGDHAGKVESTFIEAYRYQYIGSGVLKTKFPRILQELIAPSDMQKVQDALAPLL